MTPIQTTANLTGETAVLITPLPADGYDPRVEADFVPPGPRRHNIVAFPEGKQMKLPNGCTGAATFPATVKPAGLVAGSLCKLEWRGTTYIVHSYRERLFRGAIDGYTLFLTS